MSAQIPLFETAASKVDEVVAARFDVKKFLTNFGVLAEASGGTTSLRQMALHLAFQGRFTGNRRPLVPAVVTRPHEALTASRGREAATTAIRGGSALAVGEANMFIPEGWDWLPLVSVARLESGHTPSRNHADYWDGGIPWIGIRDAKNHNYGWIDATEQTVSAKGLENSSARLLATGTVCLSRTASVGYVTIMKRPMATSQDFVNWVCSDRLLPEYLMQLLRCEVPVLKRFSKGAVHQTIYFPEVKAFHISLPPLAEQKRIVAKVDQLMALCDDLEARQTKKRETGTRLTQSVLEALTTADTPAEFDIAWRRLVENFDVLLDRPEKVAEMRRALVDLASRGRLTSRSEKDGLVPAVLEARTRHRRTLWEERELARLGRAGKVPRDSKWKAAYEEPAFTPNAALPSVPVGWAYASIGLLGADPFCPVQTGPFGAQLHSSEFVAAGVPVIAVGNLTGTGFTEDGLYFITKEKADQLARYDVQAGDLLFARSGATLGKVCVAPANVKGWRMTGHILRVRLDPRVIRADVASAWLWASAAVKEQITSTIRGGTRPGYNTTLLESIVLPIPPLEEQARIVAKLGQLMKVCDDLEAKLRRAEGRAAKLVEAVVSELVA